MIISADKNKYSPPEWNVVKDIKSPIPIVLVTRLDDFEFNPELLKLDKYILICFCEYGWDFALTKTHIWGQNTGDFIDKFPGEEWKKFDEWVAKNPPILLFKRELLKLDVTEDVLPIEYPIWSTIPPVQDKESFDSRPIELMHFWGRSSEYRMRFQGDAYLHASRNGITIIDNLYYLNGYLQEGGHKRIWVTTQIPHFARLPIEQVLEVNGLSKLSLSMPGCGGKCFRHGESPVNSVMVMDNDDLAWSFPWLHGSNCIKYFIPEDDVEEAIQRDDLYNIYVAGVENARNYQIDNYTRHLEKIINSIM